MSGLGYPRVHLRSTDSTNDRARALAARGAPHGTLVTAAEQSAGHGRQGRRWSAPAGSSVLMSLVLREPPRLLPMIAAVAVAEVAGEDALIKWPNDVVLREGPGGGLAKLAGILIEGRPQERWSVLGVGVNVAVELDQLPPELSAAAAAGALPAATLGRSRAEVEPTVGRLLRALEARLSEPAAATLEAWRARDALRGREIAWVLGGSADAGRGIAGGIDGDGRLIVALAGGGQRTLGAGEVHLRAARSGG